jgi:hypothetical protein
MEGVERGIGSGERDRDGRDRDRREKEGRKEGGRVGYKA